MKRHFILHNINSGLLFCWQPPDEDQEDDVDLSTYMDMDDEMECKSAASWNPKYEFEAGGGDKNTPGLSKQSSELAIAVVY